MQQTETPDSSELDDIRKWLNGSYVKTIAEITPESLAEMLENSRIGQPNLRQELEQCDSEAVTLPELTSKDFDAAVAEGVSMVYFWCSWCPPCKVQTPVVERVVLPAVKGRAKVWGVNGDTERDLTERFAAQYTPPHFFIFKDGQFVKHIRGLSLGATLIKEIEDALTSR